MKALIVNVCSYRYPAPKGAKVISTVSKAKLGWEQELSPFYLGPVSLYGEWKSLNMENGWQYSKVYHQHLQSNGWPTMSWWEWAKKGWDNPRAVRYPMGKGKKPVYSFWNGRERLGYVDARKRIYCPLYANAVVKTEGYRKLQERLQNDKEIWLWDFDGYDYRQLDMTLKEVLNCDSRKMGHAFVLAMLLLGKRFWETANGSESRQETKSKSFGQTDDGRDLLKQWR